MSRWARFSIAVATMIGLDATAPGCYGPHFEACAIPCSDSQGCPDGLRCAGVACLATSDVGGTCPMVGGMPMDGAPQDTGSGSCLWSFTTSNLDACAPGFPAASGPATDQTLQPQPYGTSPLFVAHVSSLTVSATTGVNSGALPVLIFSDGDVVINAPIDISGVAGASGPDCPPLSPGIVLTMGGAGGGFGAPGGAGGGAGVGSGVAGGMFPSGSSTLSTLVPIEVGCRGGNAGSNGIDSTGTGGDTGGAVQISSATRIVFSGSGAVFANGSGGAGGYGAPSPTGGGGGASGGAILLEAPTIELGTSVQICAVGGGGGQGGSAISGASGTAGSSCTAGLGGSGGVSGSAGQPGGGGGTGGGLSGSDGSATAGVGAGGGGGGAGVIVLRYHTTSGTNAQLVPPAQIINLP